MSETGELFQAYREHKQTLGHERRWSADDLFRQARERAAAAGMGLTRVSDVQYQLRHPSAGWLLNIYPGNGRLYWDPNHRGPFLRMRERWSLLDVVEAAIAQEEAH
jgi:hypothetical protein